MKDDQMGIHAASPTPRELPLSNQTRFKMDWAAPARAHAGNVAVLRSAHFDKIAVGTGGRTRGGRAGERAAARAHPGPIAPAHSRKSRQRLHQSYGESC